jgi:hypothetical protein
MKIDFILFPGKSCHLFMAAAGKFGLENCKKRFGPGGFRLEFHPGAALPALGLESTIFSNVSDRYGHLHRPQRLFPRIPVQDGE